MKKVISLLALAMMTMSAWAANTYVKVTSVDQLVAGQKYILVNEEATVALGAITGTSTNYGSSVAINVANGVADIEGSDAVELTLGEGSMDALGHSTWTFDIGGEGHWICWASGNSLNTVNSPAPNNAMWIATVTDDGVVLKSKVDNARVLQYNAGAPRFACYTSTQKPAVLYVEGVPAEGGIANLSEVNGLEDDANFEFAGNAVVTVCKNGYLFLRDETGYGMISGVTGTFENGQMLEQGWNATKTSVNDGWVRYINAEGLSASGETNAEFAAAQKLTAFPDESMLNAYVYVENVTISGGMMPGLPMRSLPLPDGSDIGVTSTLWGMSWPAGGSKNVYGVLCKVDGALKINVVDFEQYVEPEPEFLRGDVNDDTYVNITDVTVLINYLLSHDATGVNLQAADCNQDTNVTITDVTVLINFLLSQSWD